MFDEYSMERKAVAMQLKNHPMFDVGMWGLNHPNGTAKDYWASDIYKLYRNIPKYEKTLVQDMGKNTLSAQQAIKSQSKESKKSVGDIEKELWYQKVRSKSKIRTDFDHSR